MKKSKIKFLISLLFLFVVLAGTLVSCKSASVTPPTTTETTNTIATKVVLHDTIFKTEKDSSFYKALLECQNGKVVLKSINKQIPGKALAPPKVIVKDNYITVDCTVEAQKLFAQWKDTYTKENQIVIKNIPYAVETPLSYWQKTEILLGRLFLGLIIIVVAMGVLKYKKYI